MKELKSKRDEKQREEEKDKKNKVQ